MKLKTFPETIPVDDRISFEVEDVPEEPVTQQPVRFEAEDVPEYLTFDDLRNDREFLDAAWRYAKAVEPEEDLRDGDEVLNWVISDRRWKDSNTWEAVSELIDVNTLPEGQEKALLEDLALIKGRWNQVAGAFDWEADLGLSERVSKIFSNVWRGALDPVNFIGGLIANRVAAKGASYAVTKAVAASMAVDASAGAATSLAIQSVDQEAGLRDELSYEEAAIQGALTAIITAPTTVLAARKMNAVGLRSQGIGPS